MFITNIMIWLLIVLFFITSSILMIFNYPYSTLIASILHISNLDVVFLTKDGPSVILAIGFN
jgi:hypothetical protein